MELLQARLAIVDPHSRSDQPFKLPQYGLTVAFNGEVYNYEEIRSTLEDRHSFQTQSDTEVLLASYALNGLDGIRSLRGMFSFAIVDEKNQETIIARDPYTVSFVTNKDIQQFFRLCRITIKIFDLLPCSGTDNLS
jgi:asparagine synthase (glutamine-hydrolysing)